MFINLDYCMGCRACEAACAARYGAPRMNIGSIKEIATLPKVCMNCELPVCEKACPSGALKKTEKGVILNSNLCIGCHSCVIACPTGALVPKLKSHIALKCDMCANEKIPVCVLTCPTKALLMEEKNNLLLSARMVSRTIWKRK